MTPPRFLLALLLATSFPLLAPAAKPNVVVFLVDDMGWGDLACYGNKIIKSPNLDKFATEGVRFTQCYSACGVCSPSRSSILTGRTPYRNGVWRWIPGGHDTHLRESEITLPELLKEHGYDTCHVGKWHLNGHFNSDKQPQPDDHGYNHWMATQNNAAPNHKNPTNFILNGKPMGRLEGFSAPLVAKEGVRWLREVRDKEKPFLLSVWTHEPHLPIESAEEFMKPYEDIDDEGIRQHHGNITQLDHAFGMVMKGLDELGLRENTIVFFTSDNGPEGRTADKGRTRGSTGGLRGRKRDSHEGGIRVAGMVRWPENIKPNTVSKTPVIGSDIFTTVLDITDIPLPADRTIDGASMLPAFEGKNVERSVPLFWRTHIAPEASHAALRIGDWKLVANSSFDKFQLYEIAKDWKEEHDLASENPAKLAALKKAFFEVVAGIDKEGPSDWWKNEKPRKKTPRKPKKAATLEDGEDKTNSWHVVKGGTVTKGELGNVLSTDGEGFAVRKLESPVTEQITFAIKYQSATSEKTRNAFLCFGDKAENSSLIKAGTAIGLGQHCIFRGGWGNVSGNIGVKDNFKPDDKLAAIVVVDLKRRTVVMESGTKITEMKLPDDLTAITHYGIYAKGTKSAFSDITIQRP